MIKVIQIKGSTKVSISGVAMELKLMAIAILVTAIDFLSACFPNLAQNLLNPQLGKTEPDFYN